MTAQPLISIVVVVHKMARQADNTLYSLSPRYQRDVDETDYEVIVVENESDDMLGAAAASRHSRNVRYFSISPVHPSPVEAVHFGVAQSTAPNIGVIIDGARIATPRAIRYALAGFRVTPHAMVTVPSYHLGFDEQHQAEGYGVETERRLLEHVRWREDGYRLFRVGVLFRGRHQPGFLRAMLESNCLFCSRADYDEIGGIDLRFDLPGGGMANLDLYRRIGDLPQTRLFVLPGEGTFHQFHGGVTTRTDADREHLMDRFKAQYAQLRGGPYRAVQKRPTLLGAVTGWAMPALESSATAELERIEAAGVGV